MGGGVLPKGAPVKKLAIHHGYQKVGNTKRDAVDPQRILRSSLREETNMGSRGKYSSLVGLLVFDLWTASSYSATGTNRKNHRRFRRPASIDFKAADWPKRQGAGK